MIIYDSRYLKYFSYEPKIRDYIERPPPFFHLNDFQIMVFSYATITKSLRNKIGIRQKLCQGLTPICRLFAINGRKMFKILSFSPKFVCQENG